MKPPHRIRIYSRTLDHGSPVLRLWYVTCKCGWQHAHSFHKTAQGFWGRETWDAALALGTGHLRERCKHV